MEIWINVSARRRTVSPHPHFGCQARIKPNVWPTLTRFEVPRNGMQKLLHSYVGALSRECTLLWEFLRLLNASQELGHVELKVIVHIFTTFLVEISFSHARWSKDEESHVDMLVARYPVGVSVAKHRAPGLQTCGLGRASFDTSKEL